MLLHTQGAMVADLYFTVRRTLLVGQEPLLFRVVVLLWRQWAYRAWNTLSLGRQQ